MSVSSYSQDLQPKKVILNNKEGVFISFALMDSITVKLIERKSILTQNNLILSLYNNEKEKVKTLQEKDKIMQENALKQENINYASSRQIDLFKDNLQIQKEETKKARKDGLKYLVLGIVLGGIAGAAIN